MPLELGRFAAIAHAIVRENEGGQSCADRVVSTAIDDMFRHHRPIESMASQSNRLGLDTRFASSIEQRIGI
eukprot:7778274-Pyramimonas_sp.AAC.1